MSGTGPGKTDAEVTLMSLDSIVVARFGALARSAAGDKNRDVARSVR